MRTLIVRNFGSEDRVVAQEQNLLGPYGWQMRSWSGSNDMIDGPREQIATSSRTSYSHQALRQTARAISNLPPAVVKCTTPSPMFSLSIYDVFEAAGSQWLQTVRPYRSKLRWKVPAARWMSLQELHRHLPHTRRLSAAAIVVRISPPLALGRMTDIRNRDGTWSHRVDRFIAPSTS
jgi:hypothetical protein